jgi:hypothetical protein
METTPSDTRIAALTISCQLKRNGQGLPPLAVTSTVLSYKAREGAEVQTMTPKPSTKDNPARDAAIRLLARGLVVPSEVAELAGVSRQLVNYWIEQAGLDWHKARTAEITKQWARGYRD